MTVENKRNTIYEGKMYREDVKSKFLSTYPNDTQMTYKRIFLKSYMLESMWDKDVCDFNQEELEQLLYSLSPLTIGASKANISTLNKYINWCIPNYTSRQTNISPLEFFKSDKEFIKKFVDDTVQLYISKQEVDDICFPDLEDPIEGTYLINPQDSALVYGLFSGITAKQLQHMKKTDISEDNTVFLRNEDESFIKSVETGEVFKLEISQECADLLRKAADSQFYHFKNGEPSKNAKVGSIEIAENDYVFRVGKTRNRAPMEPMAYHVISRRIKEIAEYSSNPHLTPKNINKSAYLYEGYKLWVKACKPNYPDGKLTTEQYQSILKKFNFAKTNGFYNSNNLRDYVTIPIIKEYYDQD